MAEDAQRTVKGYQPVRVRREEVIRPVHTRREFVSREAQRYLQKKERSWAPIAYSVFFGAILLIFSVAYVTYAFSRYRGEVLPGVSVDRVPLSGLTSKQATRLISNRLVAMGYAPVRLVYRAEGPWEPRPDEIGLKWKVQSTVNQAMAVGREGSFFAQLLDRLPLHPDHSIPLQFTLNNGQLRSYIMMQIWPHMHKDTLNANLQVDPEGNVTLEHSAPGLQLDVPSTIATIRSVVGSLHRQTRVLPVRHLPPVITDAYASAIEARINSFLSRPPVINVGRRVFVIPRVTVAHFVQFSEHPVIKKNRAFIRMDVDPTKVQAYVSDLAAQVDRQPQSPKMRFDGGTVQVVTPRRTGRTMDQADAVQKLETAVRHLTPNARLRFKVTVTQPPIDQSNPATLGINTLLGYGQSAFPGAGSGRLNSIRTIVSHLNDVLLAPGQDISLNTLVGTNWQDSDYVDQEVDQNGQLVPGDGGAMQQVATTFLRALYGSGLTLLERHSHVYRLTWYEPPVGLDAVVSPARNWDLRFHNNTGKYLLLETRVEPVRQELYIYLYGPKLKWRVAVDRLGKVLKEIEHGPRIVKQDPSLATGEVRQTAWAHNGAETTVQRTITYPNGNVSVDHITSTYQPSRAILVEGSAAATPTPLPTGQPTPGGGSHSKPKSTPVSTLGPTPAATATPVH